jgi:two-component system chemotaxis response regulator CheY
MTPLDLVRTVLRGRIQGDSRMKRKKVLLVEDNDYVRQLVSLILRDRGYSVIEAMDGQDAFNKLLETEVKIVISGLRLSRADGMEFITELRKKPAYKSLPVVVLSSEFRDHKRREAEEAGISSWIAKPFIPRQLISTVERLWNNSLSPQEVL